MDKSIKQHRNSFNLSKRYTKEGLLEVINALPLAIAVIDKNRVVLFANRATYQFVNQEEEQLIGHVGGEAFGCINHDKAPKGCGFGKECLKCKFNKVISDTIQQKEPQNMVEITMVFQSHEERQLKISTLPMVLNENEVVLLSIEDITKIKKYDQTVMEREKLSAVIKTAGGICHEINQPLMVILGYSELLLENLSKDDPRFSGLNEIHKQVTRLGEITRKLATITEYKTKKYLKTEIIDLDASSES